MNLIIISILLKKLKIKDPCAQLFWQSTSLVPVWHCGSGCGRKQKLN
jgi:hypothetical protein